MFSLVFYPLAAVGLVLSIAMAIELAVAFIDWIGENR